MKIDNVYPPSEQAEAACRAHWAQVAKPLGSLGLMEELIVQIAALTGDAEYRIDRRAVIAMCADNGVIAQGVTQADSHVTAIVAANMAKGDASVCAMGRCANCDVIPVNIGIQEELQAENLLDCCVRRGTRDLFSEPAMTREEAEQAIQTGMRLVGRLKDQGYKILCTGEMGIGNTTTSSAMAAALLREPVERVTGRGAGLTTPALQRKITVIQGALRRHRPDPEDAFDVLCKVGGLDIAGLIGVYIGGAVHRVPIVIDGFISAVAALAAVRMVPAAACAMIASHVSAEPAGKMVLDALHLTPVIHADMRLGEGTGAVMLLPMLDMAYAVYNEMVTFQETKIEQYQPLK